MRNGWLRGVGLFCGLSLGLGLNLSSTVFATPPGVVPPAQSTGGVFQDRAMRVLKHIVPDAFNSEGAYDPKLKFNTHGLYDDLPEEDELSFKESSKGFLQPLDNGGLVVGEKNEVVYDARKYHVPLDAPAPPSANPSLWRQYKLLANSKGLYEVIPGIHQVRGLDISNITFIRGKTGIIVVDPLTSRETAKAALEQYYRFLGERPPVLAVIITHSHIDHFGGIYGVISKEDLKAGKVQIYAPHGFMEEATSENVAFGNVMLRRAAWMYGLFLDMGEWGSLATGLGLPVSMGKSELAKPTIDIKNTGEVHLIDGLHFVFQMVPGTEAPAEMHFYIKEWKALCTAENACQLMHNLYTLRGAKPRNAKAWVAALEEALRLFGKDVQVLFAPHTWPLWGTQRVQKHLNLQAELYQYLHDQTVNLANQGFGPDDIAAKVKLPKSLGQYWANRGYYGSVSHNVRGIYNFYLGFFDGNPTKLFPIGRKGEAELYFNLVKFSLDGDEAKARRKMLEYGLSLYHKKTYPEAARVLSHLVDLYPTDQESKDALADAYIALGIITENATHRNYAMSAALELILGVQAYKVTQRDTESILHHIPAQVILEKVASHINPEKAGGQAAFFKLGFIDKDERYVLHLRNSVLRFWRLDDYTPSLVLGEDEPLPYQGEVVMTLSNFKAILLKRKTVQQVIKEDGFWWDEKSQNVFLSLFMILDSLDAWFNLVVPVGSLGIPFHKEDPNPASDLVPLSRL